MIHRLMCLLLLCSALSVRAQNLIPNPSFEDTICSWPGYEDPYDYPFFTPAQHWFNPNAATPDFYSVGHEEGWDCFYFSPYSSVWEDVGEWQYPMDGERMAALWVGDSLNLSREFLEVRLLQQLEADSEYCFSMYVSLGNRQNMAIDRIGAFFSVDSVYDHEWPGGGDLPMSVTSPAGIFLTDTMDWIHISGVYTAQGGEEFILIGNAFDDSETSYMEVDGYGDGWDVAKYFIDDLSLMLCSSTGIDEYSDLKVEVWTTGQSSIQLIAPTGLRYELYDSKGAILRTGVTSSEQSTIECADCASGLYFIRWQWNGRIGAKKLCI